MRMKRKIKGVDYNAEPAFERQIPAGRYEYGDEETPEVDKFKSGTSL